MPLVEFATVDTPQEAQQAAKHCMMKGGQQVQIKALQNGKYGVFHELANAPANTPIAKTPGPIDQQEYEAYKASEKEWADRRERQAAMGVKDRRASTAMAEEEALGICSFPKKGPGCTGYLLCGCTACENERGVYFPGQQVPTTQATTE